MSDESDDMTAEEAQELIRQGRAQDRRDAKALEKLRVEKAKVERDHLAGILADARQVNHPNLKRGGPGRPASYPGPVAPGTLAARVRKATANGDDQIKFFVELAAGRIEGATIQDRKDAHKWLADRSYGRAPDTVVSVEADPESSLGGFSTDELRALLAKDEPSEGQN